MRTLPLAPGLLAASLVLAACQGTAPPAAPELCAKIGGAAEVLTPGRIVLLGEMHGTVEGPAFLANLACAGLTAGRAVTVGVEIPKEEEKRIRAFLASEGGPAARAALVQGPFWDGEWKDGRSSKAMVALLDRVRVWKGQRRPVTVALLDREDAPGAPTRDESMAAAIEKAAKAEPQGVVVALTGNIHNRTKVGAPWDAAYEPMGYLASRTLADRLVSLDFASAGGTAWNCQQTPEDCGVKPLRARREGAGPEIFLHPEPDEHGYHGLFFIGPATASPPAVARKGAMGAGVRNGSASRAASSGTGLGLALPLELEERQASRKARARSLDRKTPHRTAGRSGSARMRNPSAQGRACPAEVGGHRRLEPTFVGLRRDHRGLGPSYFGPPWR